MLIVDWYQPFKHSPYSIRVIYLVLLSLSRAMRFKKENVFVVEIIPGPQEPSLEINGYLRPLVDELDMLWTDGVCLPSANSLLVLEIYRCALLSVICNIPTSRKVGSFLGHSARKGCNKCYADFESDRLDIGFQR